ncbi:MAG: hypothetical protein EPN91_04435 [Salinibacterium sp.]|nr:MAG: hypothetical protein EPN91_04435 [Salinibacterium sp.]
MTNRITIGQGSFQRSALVGDTQLDQRDPLAYITFADEPEYGDEDGGDLWAKLLDGASAGTEDELYDLVQLERSTRELITVQLRDAHLEAA